MFKFSIRDVLWLTLVVGLAAGWFADRRGLNSTISQLRDDLSESVQAKLNAQEERDFALYVARIKSGQDTGEPP